LYLGSDLVREDFYCLEDDERYDPIESCIDYYVVRDEQTKLMNLIKQFVVSSNKNLSFAASLIEKYFYAERVVVAEYSPLICDKNGINRPKDEIDLIFECKTYLKTAIALYK